MTKQSKKDSAEERKYKYKYIFDNARDGYYLSAAKMLFRVSDISFPKINRGADSEDECAKALWIALAKDRYANSEDSDIALYSLGLLDGFYGKGAEARRLQYFLESNYKGQKADPAFLKIDNRDLPDEEAKKKANALYKRELPLLNELIEHFFTIEDKSEFFRHACAQYLDFPSGGSRSRQARLPLPSYATKFDRPIYYIQRLENSDFCGREDILQTLEQGFSSKESRSVQMLYGMGGVGKTQIALKYAYAHKDEYSTIVWLDASTKDTLAASCISFLRMYDETTDTTTLKKYSDINAAFLRFVEKRASLLLILDNVDYLDEDSDNARKMAKLLLSFIPASNSHVLITTRCNRELQGIRRIPVNIFTPNFAIEFLEKRAGQKADESAELLAEKLGYLPLALEYAGAYISMHSTYIGYLDLWKEYGLRLFDNNAGYAKQTVRKAFNITLEKLRRKPDHNDSLMLLCLLAEYADNYIPVKEFAKGLLQIEAKRETREGKNKIEYVKTDPVHPNWIDGFRKRIERIKRETVRYPPSYVFGNKIKLNELIRELADYSLVEWDGHRVSMHPLLREVILDEYNLLHNEDEQWARLHSLKMMAGVYQISGDLETAEKTRYISHLLMVQIIEDMIDRVVTERRKENLNADNILISVVCFANFFCQILEYGNADAMKQFFMTSHKFIKMLYESCNSVSIQNWHQDFENLPRSMEWWCFALLSRISKQRLVFRGYNTLENYKKTGKKYYLGMVEPTDLDEGTRSHHFINFHEEYLDNLEGIEPCSVYPIIDVWISYTEESAKEFFSLQEDEEKEWWIMGWNF